MRKSTNEATQKMYLECKNNPDKFEKTEFTINSAEDFEKIYSIELRDFNSAGVVAANQGLPLSKMTRHSYMVYGQKIQVAKEQIRLCKEAIDNLVIKL